MDGIDAEMIEQIERLAKVVGSMEPIYFVKMLIPAVFSTGNILSVIIALITTKSIRSLIK